MIHIHWARRVFQLGLNDYLTCRCGARRTIRVGRYGKSPIDIGWPPPEDGWRAP